MGRKSSVLRKGVYVPCCDVSTRIYMLETYYQTYASLSHIGSNTVVCAADVAARQVNRCMDRANITRVPDLVKALRQQTLLR